MSTKEQKIVEEKPTTEAKVEPSWNITRVVYILLCTIGGLVVGHRYTQYSKQLHENDMWFSNIMEVEREISFRTEAGLYYSYYKQLVLAPTFSKGINDLIQDNKTEHLRTINILERFNIYQEVVLAAIYRNLPISLKENWESIYFYLDSIYALNGMMMFSLFCSAGVLSGNPAAGFLANAYFILNRPHVTRLYKTAPLREHFSLPFIYLQLLLLSFYFKKNLNKNIERLALVGVGLATFSFNLAWQFSQFVMLLQMFALFGSYSLLTLDKRKVKVMIYVYMLSLGAVCTLMFGNDMLYTSLIASFCCAFLITLHLPIEDKYEGALRKIFLLVFRITFVLALTAVLNYATKTITDGESDSHVYNFVLTKFGFNNQEVKNFDVRLYLCNGGFDFMDVRYEAEALTEGMLFPSYAISISIALIAMLVSFLRSLRESSSTTNWMQEHPEVAYHIMLNMFFGLVAVSTQRMKFLWLPHVCVISAALLCNRNVWRAMLEKVKIKGTLNWLMQQSLIAVLLGLLIQKKLPILQEELSGLYQFEDPDTVELMQWIKTNTRRDAAFTGSMQLLAGVKLCTDRPITNHPHYENKFLRERTKQVYQIYAKRSPKDVHAILCQHDTSYIILENSICYSRLSCKLTDNLDADTPNTSTARFCDAIKRGTRAFTRYFEKVFENRTFYMYRVKRIKSE